VVRRLGLGVGRPLSGELSGDQRPEFGPERRGYDGDRYKGDDEQLAVVQAEKHGRFYMLGSRVGVEGERLSTPTIRRR
jgi:hypothetical protein